MTRYTVYMTTELTAVVTVEAKDFETAEDLAFNRVPFDPLPGSMYLPDSDGIVYTTSGSWEPAGGWNEDTDEQID